MKAHHSRRLTYHSISIMRPALNMETGSLPPVAVVLPESGEMDEGQIVKLSISHDGDYATAVCLAPDYGAAEVVEEMPIKEAGRREG